MGHVMKGHNSDTLIDELQCARVRKANELEQSRKRHDGNVSGHLKTLQELTKQQLKAELAVRHV